MHRFYIVHQDDIGKDPETVRASAYISDPNPNPPQVVVLAAEFVDWVNIHKPAFPCALVDSQGVALAKWPNH
jgi:hypothetical protein